MGKWLWGKRIGQVRMEVPLVALVGVVGALFVLACAAFGAVAYRVGEAAGRSGDDRLARRVAKYVREGGEVDGLPRSEIPR